MGLKPVETLLDVLHFADGKTAFILPDLEIDITYVELRAQVASLADALVSAGVQRGDRVAMALPNGLPAVVCFLAASIAGTAAPLNPAYPYEEFLFFLKDTNARILLCPTNEGEEAKRAAKDLGIPVLPVEVSSRGEVLFKGAPKGKSAVSPAPDDIALILHTSGSTGLPKRVPLRHFNLAVSAANIANSYLLRENDVSLCIMPLFHIHGMMASAMATLLTGGTVVLPSKFNALAFWRLVQSHGITWYSGVPTMHQTILSRTREKPANCPLRFIRSCSAPFSVEAIEKLEQLLEVPVVEAYGMTEASHQMSSNPLPPRARKPGSVGISSGLRVSIVDDAGNHLANGQRGEVVIQGANVFHGYENNPKANAESFVRGWFRTGDQGFLDEDCYLRLTGRIKDIIIRGGENIAPHEVDEILLKHPAIANAVTFGFPHPTLGEEVAAAIVLQESASLTESALLKYCCDNMADFKAPKKIYFVKSIPITGSGKVRRRAVATALLEKSE